MCPLIYGPPIWLGQYTERFNYICVITLELHGDTTVLWCHLFVLWGQRGICQVSAEDLFGISHVPLFKEDQWENLPIVAAAVEIKLFLFIFSPLISS